MVPLPNRQLKVVLPPVSAYPAAGTHSSLLFGAPDGLSNQPFSETAVAPRNETRCSYNLWHNQSSRSDWVEVYRLDYNRVTRQSILTIW